VEGNEFKTQRMSTRKKSPPVQIPLEQLVLLQQQYHHRQQEQEQEQQGKRRSHPRDQDEDEDEIEAEPDESSAVECSAKDCPINGTVALHSQHQLPEMEAHFKKLFVSLSQREREFQEEEEYPKKELDLDRSCKFHQKILREARQRNTELMATYRSCFDDLDDEDERFEPTRRLYLKLIGELDQANKKMDDIELELMKKSSISPSLLSTR
jgi:hypothetical protein